METKQQTALEIAPEKGLYKPVYIYILSLFFSGIIGLCMVRENAKRLGDTDKAKYFWYYIFGYIAIFILTTIFVDSESAATMILGVTNIFLPTLLYSSQNKKYKLDEYFKKDGKSRKGIPGNIIATGLTILILGVVSIFISPSLDTPEELIMTMVEMSASSEEITTEIETALKEKPNDPDILMIQSMQLADSGKYTQALETVWKAEESSATEPFDFFPPAIIPVTALGYMYDDPIAVYKVEDIELYIKKSREALAQETKGTPEQLYEMTKNVDVIDALMKFFPKPGDPKGCDLLKPYTDEELSPNVLSVRNERCK